MADVRDVFQLAGTTLEGRFRVDRAIAEGGFGVVYYGQQAALERPVALKVLKTPPRFDDAAKQQFLASFATEAKTIARITHPNIVLVYDFGVSVMPSGERAAWMALEWLTGVTLDHELVRRRWQGGRSPTECLDIMRPALSALAVVHAAGVAHRDLKPANIMLVETPTGTTPKLLDFGIAKIMEADELPGSGQTQTRSSQVAFSPGYASPEQISQGRSGPWTDVHAMGLMLTEMLTDRPPLEGDETSLIFQQIVDRVRPTPAKFGMNVGAWEGVLTRALAVSPSERYRDASELIAALEATVTDATTTGAISHRVSVRPGGTLSTPGRTGALVEMLTEPAPFADGKTPVVAPRMNVTTGRPTSDGAPHELRRTGSRVWPYALGGGMALVGLAAAGYVKMSSPSNVATTTASAPPAALVGGASSVASEPAASAAPATSSSSPSPVPLPSSAPSSLAPDPAITSAPPVPGALHAPSHGQVHAPGQGSAPSRPRAPGRVVVE